MLGDGSLPAWLVGRASVQRLAESIKMHIVFDPVISPLGLYPIEVTAAVCHLFVQEYLLQHCLQWQRLGRKRVLSAREWLDKMWHTVAWISVALDLDSHEERQRTMYNRILS